MSASARRCGPRTCCFPSTARYGTQVLARRARCTDILLYWGGDERGTNFAGPPRGLSRAACPSARRCRMPPARPWPSSIRGEARCARGLHRRRRHVAGRVLRGDQPGGRAARCRVVYVIVNNGWAISAPGRGADRRTRPSRRRASRPASRACRSTATTSSPCAQCVGSALERARGGGGADASSRRITYRLSDHTTCRRCHAAIAPPRSSRRRMGAANRCCARAHTSRPAAGGTRALEQRAARRTAPPIDVAVQRLPGNAAWQRPTPCSTTCSRTPPARASGRAARRRHCARPPRGPLPAHGRR